MRRAATLLAALALVGAGCGQDECGVKCQRAQDSAEANQAATERLHEIKEQR